MPASPFTLGSASDDNPPGKPEAELGMLYTTQWTKGLSIIPISTTFGSSQISAKDWVPDGRFDQLKSIEVFAP